MRLLLLPVLYNAMAQSEDPNHHVFSPMFCALHAAMLASTYAPLVVKAGHGISHSALPAQQGEQVRPAACSWHVSAHHLGCCGAGIGMHSRCSNGTLLVLMTTGARAVHTLLASINPQYTHVACASPQTAPCVWEEVFQAPTTPCSAWPV